MSGDAASPGPAVGRWQMLALVAGAEVLGMSAWFSASAVSPELAGRWGLDLGQVGWRWAFAVLAFGPAFGIAAIRRLARARRRVRYSLGGPQRA